MKCMRIVYCLVIVIAMAFSNLFAIEASRVAESNKTQVVTFDDTVVNEESHEGHHNVTLFGRSLNSLSQFGISVFNFSIFVGILYLLLKQSLLFVLRKHRKDLSDKLLKAEQDKYEANCKIQELDNRMSTFQYELDKIMEKATVDAKIEHDKIIESAKSEAEQIVIQARLDITSLKKKAENELCNIVSEMVITTTTQYLKERVRDTLASYVLDESIEKMRSIE